MREVGLHASIPSLVDFLGWTGIVFVFWYGAHQAIRGEITIGSLIGFSIYLTQIFNSLTNLAEIFTSLQKVCGVSERIFEILDTKSDVKELPTAIALNNIRGSIEFRNVSYGYDKEDSQKLVLDNINFKIEEREKIALVGASGIGKTTIVNLLLRFYELQKGEILIDDINIKNIKISSLREQIGVVLQEPILFNTTIKENIRYGKLDAKDEEIVESAKIANAHSFIINLPDKYDTIVGDKGCRLSVGERQRICIARAIIKNPKILILDEPTSSIDREGEEKVFEAIKNVMQDRTTIIISHRESILKYVDRVLYLKDGKIYEKSEG
jgi:subfamily B ATP-binding cassette protein MsbA